MNKKIGILFVFVLLVGAVFLSGCQQEVARKISNVADGGGAQVLMPREGDRAEINPIQKENTVLLSLNNRESYGGLTLNGVYAGADEQRSYFYCDVTYNRRRESIIEGEVGSVSVPGEDTSYVAVLNADIDRGICRLILIK